MAAFDGNIAQLTFESANLEPETFQVVRFEGEEQLSQPFRFVIELLSEDPAVALSDVVNQPATLTVQGVAVHGIVEDMQQRGHTAEYYGYQVVLVPRVALLGLMFQSRIFQEMTVEDIVTQVLEEAGLSDSQFRFELEGSYLTRLYTVQYQETDLNFVSRLLEHEGIWYYFEHTDDGDVLVMTDSPTGGPPIEGDSTLPYNEGAALLSEENVEAVREFVCHQRVVTGKVVLKDYNYETPNTELVSESQINDEMPGVRYEYGPNYPDQDEGDRLARVRNEEIECQRLVMLGDSDSPRFHVGFKFKLDQHFRDDLNIDFLFTHVRHVGDQGAALPWLSASEGAPGYRNEFTCIPTDVPFRPPRVAPVPRLHGILTAKVETAGGDYAYLDDQGRYRVKMPFDLSDVGDGEASLPIRMAQPYSGPGYGMHMPNHAGTEMVWACVNGDLDRPLALSTVPNPSQAAPVTGSNNPQNVFRTWGQNELTFDDAQGEENIYMHATKDRNTVVVNNHTENIGNDQSIGVAGNRSVSVEGNETVHVHGNQIITIDGAPPPGGGGGTTGNGISVTGDYTLETSNLVHIKAPTSITLECPGSTIKLEPGKITLAAGGGAQIVLDANAAMWSSAGSKVFLDGDALMQSVAASKVFLDGNALTKSSGGSSVFLDGKALTKSNGGSSVLLDGDANMQAASGGQVLLDGDAKMTGGTATVEGGGATVVLDGGASISGNPVKLN